MMALSLMAEYGDVRLAEWPAYSLYFTGTKWIDLWVVYMIFMLVWTFTRGCMFTLLFCKYEYLFQKKAHQSQTINPQL